MNFSQTPVARMTNRLTGNMNLNTVTDLVHLIFVWFEFHLKVNLKAFKDPGVCIVPGGGISRSVVCWTLVLPGRGSKAGTRAENCLFRTKSSSHVLLRPPLVSYSSSSCKTVNHYSCCQISADLLVLFYDPSELMFWSIKCWLYSETCPSHSIILNINECKRNHWFCCIDFYPFFRLSFMSLSMLQECNTKLVENFFKATKGLWPKPDHNFKG